MINKKNISFSIVIIFLIFFSIECMLRIIFFTKNKIAKKENAEWNYSDCEKELVNIHEKNRENVQKFGSFVQFSGDLYDLEKNKYYKPRPNSSIAVIRNEHIGHMSLLLDAEVSELLKDFNGEIYYKNFNELSLRKTGREKLGDIAILALGDSFTEGCYVNDEDTFSAYLERYGAKDGFKINVFNAGIAGYNTPEEYFRFIDLIPDKKIDILILSYFANDINVSEHKVIGNWEPKEPQNEFGKWIFDNILVAGLIIEGYYSIFAKSLDPEKSKEVESGWQESFHYLSKIKKECDKNKVVFFLSAIPSKEHFAFNNTSFYQDKLKIFCDQEGIIFIDPYDYFKSRDIAKLYLDWDPHFTKEGHRIYGEYVYNQIKPVLKTIKMQISK